MDSLTGIKTVIAVVESGSFTAAGKKLGFSKGLVSKYIQEVEAQLNVRLFNRNTRTISLTDAGNHYYEHAIKLVDNYKFMVDEVVAKQSSARGLLRISSPIAFGEHVLAKLIVKFHQQYPDITIELILANETVNMLEDNIDIRIKSGKVEDSNMIARQLCKWPLIICASPSYLKKHGTPQIPQALTEHHCVLDNNLKSGKHWTFFTAEEEIQTVLVQSSITSNNPQAVLKIVKAGGGIGLMAKASVADELKQGSLIELFSDHKVINLDIFLIYPHRKHIPQKTQCFIDFMLRSC